MLSGIVTHHKMYKLVIRSGCEHETLQRCCRWAHRNTGNSVRTILLISNARLSEISGRIPSNITWAKNLDLSQAAGHNEKYKGKFRCCKNADFRLMFYCSYISAAKQSAPLNPLGSEPVPISSSYFFNFRTFMHLPSKYPTANLPSFTLQKTPASSVSASCNILAWVSRISFRRVMKAVNFSLMSAKSVWVIHPACSFWAVDLAMNMFPKV